MSNTSQVAFITGADRGIGYAISQRLIAAGHQVAVASRHPQLAAGVLSCECDVTDTSSVEAAFAQVEAELGPVGILVANAGITRDELLLRMSDEDFNTVIDTNLTGAFRVIRRASRAMVKARYGRIVLVGSVIGSQGGIGQINYAASKAGMVGLARATAKELGAKGITANVVAPGFINTDMTAELDPALIAQYEKQIPAGRIGAVADVAAAVEFLTREEAGYINGAVIPVDGGLGMGH